MMTRRIIAHILPLILLAGCVSREPKPTATQLDASYQIIKSFVTQVSALGAEFPELAEFKKRNPDTQTQLEVRFSNGVGLITEMRGVCTPDLKPKGIHLHFLVRRKDNPVSTQAPIIPLDTLGMNLYLSYVLSDDATLGLNEKLDSIFSQHKELFIELNKNSAPNAIVQTSL